MLAAYCCTALPAVAVLNCDGRGARWLWFWLWASDEREAIKNNEAITAGTFYLHTTNNYTNTHTTNNTTNTDTPKIQ